MEQNILFSLILPAYNEELRLPDCMEKVAGFVASRVEAIEVILVENGSTDRTYEMGLEYAKQYPWLTVLHEDKAGKGNAVRRGMLEAAGRYRMFADVDFAMPIEELDHFIPKDGEHYDVAIASREAKGAVRINEPAIRRFSGRVFNLVVQILVTPGIRDTQCGFKSFSAEAAEKLFRLQRVDGWAFDAELLYLARKFGYKINEVPIRCYYIGNSKVNVASDSLKMLKELIQIRKNDREGLYETAENSDVVTRDQRPETR